MGNTTCHNNGIHLATKSHITGTHFSGNGIEHSIDHTLERFFTGLGLGCNGNHIVQTEVSRETTATIEHLLDLKFAILATEAKVHQLTGRNGSRTLGTERPVTVESIVHIDYFSLAMRTHRDTTAQMYHDNVQVLVCLTDRSSILTGNRLTVQRMENGFAFDVRNTGIS